MQINVKPKFNNFKLKLILAGFLVVLAIGVLGWVETARADDYYAEGVVLS
ncbi:MAG: hypothetical protein U9R06_00270 [Patescibacteria group bacterium]|nr:hypothetical protein [Patescibacteria group bacterium]